jgi:riboflavin synthase alpha subunit
MKVKLWPEIIFIFVLVFMSCDITTNENTENSDNLTYRSSDSAGNVTELIITRNNNRAMIFEEGDTYILKYNNVVVSSGTISVEGNELTFTSLAGKTWTAAINEDTITDISEIETDDGKKIVIETVTKNAIADSIKVVSITPNNSLFGGRDQEFTVEIEYDLSTQTQGEICIGFNSSKLDTFALVEIGENIVAKGHGTKTYTVTARTRNWFSKGQFCVYVNLSPYPHADTWKPLVSNTTPLSFSADDTFTDYQEQDDSIRVVSISPDSGLSDGRDQEFTVEIEYDLSTQTEATIWLGFNSLEEPEAFTILEIENDVVAKGHGTKTYTVTERTKDWSSIGKQFCVGVRLVSPVPDTANRCSILASDSKPLSFETE